MPAYRGDTSHLKQDLARLVEPPLLEACQTLFDNGWAIRENLHAGDRGNDCRGNISAHVSYCR